MPVVRNIPEAILSQGFAAVQRKKIISKTFYNSVTGTRCIAKCIMFVFTNDCRILRQNHIILLRELSLS
jgi:hypothetical protein